MQSHRSASKSLQSVSESVRDSAEQIASEISSKASAFASDAAESAGEMYGKASEWLQDNYGKTLSVLGALAAAGAIGYFIGSKVSERQQRKSLS